MSPIVGDTYYEVMPNGEFFIVPIKRSLAEVIMERTKVASYFQGTMGGMEILSGVCDVMKADLVFDKKEISVVGNKFPIHIKLQNLIDIYNDVTGEDVLNDYKKKEAKRIRRKTRPYSSAG